MVKFANNFKDNDNTLFNLQAVVLFLFCVTLTFSKSILYNDLLSGLQWKHWIGFIVWVISSRLVIWSAAKRGKNFYQNILQIGTFISGIGLMTIWRLNSDFGFRQSMIYLVTCLFITWLLSAKENLDLIKSQKKYLIFIGLLLSILTLFFGSNPSGIGPRLWLGCCGVYLQPSEPLKIIFIFVIASFLPNLRRSKNGFLTIAAISTFIFAILIAQRDLGTSSIFLLIFGTLLYVHTGSKKLLTFSVIFLVVIGIAAYFGVDLVQQRIDTWINPWKDPTGSSYQVIQSLIAIANGGVFGRGIGIGYPNLVPISHSDFIFTSITEESGLVGGLFILMIFVILSFQGFSIAIKQRSQENKYLASGLSVYIAAQTIVIIGGNIKLLPLTGVTLPFLSYGGSSLFSSWVAIVILFLLSESIAEGGSNDAQPDHAINLVFRTILIGFTALSLGLGWWVLYRADNLLSRSDNPRRAISDYFVHRGSILDRNNTPLAITIGNKGSFQRSLLVSSLAPILGYSNPLFGQSNIEESYDLVLRGEKGYPDLTLWWNHLLYGMPLTGLNIRTTIDLKLQEKVAEYFDRHEGASVLLNSENGELLALASGPNVDVNRIDGFESDAIQGNAPLLNRVSQGQYPMVLVKTFVSYVLAKSSGAPETANVLDEAHFYVLPKLGFESRDISQDTRAQFAPIQAAKLVAGISKNGICPGLSFVSAIQSPEDTWVILQKEDSETECFQQNSIEKFAEEHISKNHMFWSTAEYDSKSNVTFYAAGTMPNWDGTPLTLVALVEKQITPAAKFELDKIFSSIVLQN